MTTKELLQAAREGLSPDAAALARVKAKVATTAVATTATTALALKIAASLAVAGVVATTIAVTSRRSEPALIPPPPTVPVSVSVPATAAVSVPTAAVSVPAPVSVTAPGPVTAPAPVPATATVHHITIAPAPPAETPAVVIPVPPPTRASLSREVSLVDSAQSALRSGDFRSALSIIHTYATETADSGQLAEDAAAIEVEALCRLADSAAAAHLSDFDARWPHSAERTRLTSACK